MMSQEVVVVEKSLPHIDILNVHVQIISSFRKHGLILLPMSPEH